MARLRKQADDESVLLPELVKAILIGPFRGFANPRAITSPGTNCPEFSTRRQQDWAKHPSQILTRRAQRRNCLTGRRVGSPDHLFQMSPHCGVGEKTLFTCAGRNAGH